MIILLPRFASPRAALAVQQFLERGVDRWKGFDPTDLPEAIRFAATGGRPISAPELAAFRTHLVTLATDHGFGTSDKADTASFDTHTAAWLATHALLQSGEALRDDFWSFVGCVLAPDIVHWRYGKLAERYIGGIRNTFQRLWLRAVALDRGAEHPDRWGLVRGLTEDALVQITERTSIGGDHTLARAIAEVWHRASTTHPGGLEARTRRAVLRIRVRNEIVSLAELPPDELDAFITAVFELDEPSTARATKSRAAKYAATPTRAAPEPSDPVPAAGERDRPLTVVEAADVIQAAAKRLRLLSPTALVALDKLRADNVRLARAERNAINHLLQRLSDQSALQRELDRLRKAAAD